MINGLVNLTILAASVVYLLIAIKKVKVENYYLRVKELEIRESQKRIVMLIDNIFIADGRGIGSKCCKTELKVIEKEIKELEEVEKCLK